MLAESLTLGAELGEFLVPLFLGHVSERLEIEAPHRRLKIFLHLGAKFLQLRLLFIGDVEFLLNFGNCQEHARRHAHAAKTARAAGAATSSGGWA